MCLQNHYFKGKILAIIKDATSECSSTARLAGRG